MQLPANEELVMLAGAPPIRARKVRYYLDAQLRARIGAAPGSTTGRPAESDWRDVIPTVTETAADRAARAAEEGGLRLDPEPVQEETPAPEARPRLSEFDWWADGEADSVDADFARRAASVARQASLDPDDGVAL